MPMWGGRENHTVSAQVTSFSGQDFPAQLYSRSTVFTGKQNKNKHKNPLPYTEAVQYP